MLRVALLTTALVLSAGPAVAGQDITIEMQNNLPPTQPLYPRLMLRGTDNLCWYDQDFADGRPAPAGGGFASTKSEVRNTFFSFCNPTWNPLKEAFARWMQFELVSQAAPGAPWKPATWGEGYSSLLMTYFKFPMDVRGYHFQIAGPRPDAVLDVGGQRACVSIDPPVFNYSDLFRMKVTAAKDGSCGTSASGAATRIPTRTVRLRVGATRPVVLGSVTHSKASSWRADRVHCTSDHFTTSRTRVANGPGSSRWQVVNVTGTSPGRDVCIVNLSSAKGQELMSQRIRARVR